MKTIVKKARELGTSAGVLLPRSWLNKRVVVTLSNISKDEITRDIINILIEKKLNKEIKGIYLFGSYARGDPEVESDIDVLVITEKTNKLVSQDNYELNLVSEEKLYKNISYSLYYQSIIRESEALINKNLIEKYLSKRYKLKSKKILSEIKKVINIDKDSIETSEKLQKKIPDGIIYSLILRLRELYLIKCIISNKSYSKKVFVSFVGEENYSAYKRIKKEQNELSITSPEEAKKLVRLSEKWLKEIKD